MRSQTLLKLSLRIIKHNSIPLFISYNSENWFIVQNASGKLNYDSIELYTFLKYANYYRIWEGGAIK